MNKKMEALEALREICKSSHCVSDTLRIKLKPWEVTARKNIVYNALTELAEIKKRAEEKMAKLSETETSFNNLHKDGSLTEYWEDERKREVIEDKRLIDYILKGETK